jgi:hypothetical protein
MIAVTHAAASSRRRRQEVASVVVAQWRSGAATHDKPRWVVSLHPTGGTQVRGRLPIGKRQAGRRQAIQMQLRSGAVGLKEIGGELGNVFISQIVGEHDHNFVGKGRGSDPAGGNVVRTVLSVFIARGFRSLYARLCRRYQPPVLLTACFTCHK